MDNQPYELKSKFHFEPVKYGRGYDLHCVEKVDDSYFVFVMETTKHGQDGQSAYLYSKSMNGPWTWVPDEIGAQHKDYKRRNDEVWPDLSFNDDADAIMEFVNKHGLPEGLQRHYFDAPDQLPTKPETQKVIRITACGCRCESEMPRRIPERQIKVPIRAPISLGFWSNTPEDAIARKHARCRVRVFEFEGEDREGRWVYREVVE